MFVGRSTKLFAWLKTGMEEGRKELELCHGLPTSSVDQGMDTTGTRRIDQAQSQAEKQVHLQTAVLPHQEMGIVRSHNTEEARNSEGKPKSERRKRDVALVFASPMILSTDALNDLIRHDLAHLFAQSLIASGFTAKHFRSWKSKSTHRGRGKGEE